MLDRNTFSLPQPLDPAEVAIPEAYITSASKLEECCEHLRGQECFAIDTEFIGEDTYYPRLCLVQVATHEQLFVIDAIALSDLDCFWDLIRSGSPLVVFHGGRVDLRLCRLWAGTTPAKFFDSQIAAALVGLGYPLSLGRLIETLFGIRIESNETLTDWQRRPLTPDQIAYAFDDVRYLLPAYRVLREELARLDRLGWADEEFAALAQGTDRDDEDSPRWRKLKGVGKLTGQQLAVVRALYAWREETAARRNRPPRSILRDDLIVRIAQRQPTTRSDLRIIRGIPKAYVHDIIETVKKAKREAADTWPQPAETTRDTPEIKLLAQFLGIGLAARCGELQVSPEIVCNQAALRSLVRREIGRQPGPTPLDRGWRQEHILPTLLSLLRGEKTLLADIAAGPPLRIVPRFGD